QRRPRLRPRPRAGRAPGRGARHAARTGARRMNSAHEVRMFEGARRVDGIAADDRAFAYGEGLFETLRAHAGSLPWWDAHWARLAHGAQRLGLPLPNPERVRAEADTMFASGGNGGLNLLPSRGGARC